LKTIEKLGVDVGKVIIDGIHNDNTDTSFFSDNYLSTTAVDGVFEALRTLVDSRFGENVFIVSRCRSKVEQKTRAWFEHHRFYERTGISEANVHFCRTRPEKAPICEGLGITHFVDDNPEVMLFLKDIVPHLYLFNSDPRAVFFAEHSLRGKVTCVGNWKDVLLQLPSSKEARAVGGASS
jgi:hypothetical protein